MKQHAKAALAGSTSGRGGRLGSIFRAAIAIRAASGDAHGSGAPSHRSARLTIGLLLAALVLLSVAPSAMAVLTRAKTASFGSQGGGACPAGALATGTGDLSAATGTGSLNSQAPGAGAKAITELTTSTGAFAVGMSIAADGIPPGTTITATGADTLTLSNDVTAVAGAVVLTAGSTEVDSVATGCGAFAVGQAISGKGIAAKTTITALGAGTLTLSKPPTVPGAGVQLSASSSFGKPGRLAFNQANDKLYVLDAEPTSIHAFNAPALTPAGGAFPLALAEGATNAGIGVDNTLLGSANNLYYATNVEPRKIYGFNSAGAPLGGNFPIEPGGTSIPCGSPAVDSAGNLAVADFDFDSKRVRRYDSAGNELLAIDTASQGQPCNVAFDSNDDMFVAMFHGPVWRYSAASAYSPASASEVIPTGTRAIAIDTATHILYAAHEGKATAYETNGTPLYSFAGGIPSASFDGIAIDQGTDRVYLSDSANGKAYAFGSAQDYGDPTVTLNPASHVNFFSADIGATITDNNAQQTSWRFEISADGGLTWSTVKSGQSDGNEVGTEVTATPSGLSPNSTYEFRIATNKGSEAATEVTSSPLGFKTLTPPPATVTPSAAKNITETSAEIGATITDNNVLPTSWRIEISPDDGASWFTARMSSGSATGTTTGGQSGVAIGGTTVGYLVSEKKEEITVLRDTDLSPNSDYKFRVVTNKGSAAATEVPSFALGFHTATAPPTLSDLGAIQVSDTSARMVATIDTHNSPSGYVFQYGTTPALGSSSAPLDIGAATKPITISQLIGGLNPDTTYYFRLVATNLIGTTTSSSKTLHTRTDPLPPANPGNCSNQALRQEQSATFLPDCRAYEMVSPADKNQGSVIGSLVQFAPFAFARDGEGVAVCANALFGEPPAQLSFNCAPYIARRGPGGWTSKSPFPHYCPFGFESSGGSFNAYLPRLSYDRVALAVPEFPSACDSIDPAAPQSSINLYREDLTTDPFDFNLLAPNNNGTRTPSTASFGGGSDDFSHIVYTSFYNQTADSPTPEEHFKKLYDWEEEGHGDCTTPGGCLSLVSVDPNGNPFTGPTIVPAYGEGGSGTPVPGSVSADGERIYFQALNSFSGGDATFSAEGCETADCSLYLRENDETTFHVAASECTSACGVDSSLDQFVWANPAGDISLFLSCAKLTDASSAPGACSGQNPFFVKDPGKLYRWERNGAPGHRLVDLSVDEEPADGDQPHAIDLIGASDDGNTVYFVAGGQLVPGAPTGKISGTSLKLYRWSWNGGDPSLDYLAPYLSTWANGTSVNPDSGVENDPNADRYHVRVTPDGKYLLIQTKLAYDPAADRDSDADLYRWDQADGWLCVSCQLPGVPSAGQVSSLEPRLLFNAIVHEYVSQEPEHTISDDGRRVFFSTPDALVPEDVNGDAGCEVQAVEGAGRGTLYSCADIYEWHDGTVSLLSSGSGIKPFMLIGATHTGKDVFFATAQRMVGWDTDNGVDVYDVRAGGGFPEPPARPLICEGAEQCHGAGTSAPPVTGAGTAVFEGPGNPAPKHNTAPKHHKKRHHKRAQKHRQRAAGHNRRAGR